MSKAYRLSKIFRPETGNTLILPIDHGVSAGSIAGLENPHKTLEELNIPEVDAVLMSDGFAKHAESVFYGRNAPGRMQAADVVYMDNNKIYHELNTSVEVAVRRGYDCLKFIMFWDRPAEEQIQTVQVISNAIQEAEKWDMPVLVEPVTFEPIEDEEERIQVLTDGARVAYELGADILKLPHPGNVDTIKSWVNTFNVPIILLGGAVKGEVADLVAQVDEAVSAGVKGVAIGRNLWQRPIEEAKHMLSEFARVIHKQ